MVISERHPDAELKERHAATPDKFSDPWLLAGQAEQILGRREADPRVDVPRLREAMEASSNILRPFRTRHAEAVALAAGSRYGDSSLDKTALNLLQIATRTWTRKLVSKSPRVLVSTRSVGLKPDAYELQLALNHLLEKINLGDALGEVVRSALFSIGILKLGIDTPNIPYSEFTEAGGEPFAEPVLFEDFVFDTNARRFEECDFIGNRFRMHRDAVMKNPDFDAAVKAKIALAIEKSELDELDTSARGEQRTSDLSTGGRGRFKQVAYHKQLDLWDIYLPSENLIVTMMDDAAINEALLIREWTGPANPTGPYRMLMFDRVVGNIMPSPPAQSIFDMQELLGRLFRQLSRQSERQKTITVSGPAGATDGTAETIKSSADGDFVSVQHPEDVKQLRYGGADVNNQNFVRWIRDLLSYQGGNLDSLAGLSSSAESVGQEELLAATSSEMLAAMGDTVFKFAKGTVTDLGFYLYTDPFVEFELEKEIEGLGSLPFKYGPGNRQEDFFKFNFNIAPYSMKGKGPEEKLARITQVMMQIAIPLGPQLQQYGVNLNLRRFMELISELSDIPEFAEIFSTETPLSGEMRMNPPDTQAQTPGRRPLQSPVTQRNYTRTSKSSGAMAELAKAKELQAMASMAKEQQGNNTEESA